jgi:uncharacterized membrane protein
LTSTPTFDIFSLQESLSKEVIMVSNILGVVIGVVVIIVGLYLLFFQWWSMFVRGLMAVVPILLVLIGAGALVYFISEIKSKIDIGKEETSPSGSKEQKTE